MLTVAYCVAAAVTSDDSAELIVGHCTISNPSSTAGLNISCPEGAPLVVNGIDILARLMALEKQVSGGSGSTGGDGGSIIASLSPASPPPASPPPASPPPAFPPPVHADCRELYDGGEKRDGLYTVTPSGASAAIDTFCDMTRNGGGWSLVANTRDTTKSKRLTLHHERSPSLNTAGMYTYTWCSHPKHSPAPQPAPPLRTARWLPRVRVRRGVYPTGRSSSSRAVAEDYWPSRDRMARSFSSNIVRTTTTASSIRPQGRRLRSASAVAGISRGYSRTHKSPPPPTSRGTKASTHIK